MSTTKRFKSQILTTSLLFFFFFTLSILSSLLQFLSFRLCGTFRSLLSECRRRRPISISLEKRTISHDDFCASHLHGDCSYEYYNKYTYMCVCFAHISKNFFLLLFSIQLYTLCYDIYLFSCFICFFFFSSLPLKIVSAKQNKT